MHSPSSHTIQSFFIKHCIPTVLAHCKHTRNNACYFTIFKKCEKDITTWTALTKRLGRMFWVVKRSTSLIRTGGMSDLYSKKHNVDWKIGFSGYQRFLINICCCLSRNSFVNGFLINDPFLRKGYNSQSGIVARSYIITSCNR